MSNQQPKQVFYPASLPSFGVVSSHPQFQHLDHPPDGYTFVRMDAKELPARSAFAQRLLTAWRMAPLLAPCFRLIRAEMKQGVPLREAAAFVRSRHLSEQLYIPASAGLVFLPTWPYIVNQVPWVIEIEDIVTLFAPFVQNGQSASIEIRKTPYFGMLKALLESPQCRGIICHVRSTKDSVPRLFESETLKKKMFYAPIGVTLPPESAIQKGQDQIVRLLFSNSWHQQTESFYGRGGVDVLEAFAQLAPRYPQLRLILRTRLPEDLSERHREIARYPQVQLVDQFLSREEMTALLGASDIYLLPSARMHVVSLLQAMSYQMAIVASDGWGIEEYVENERTGLIVQGRYGKCSWVNEEGWLCEDYTSLRFPDPVIVEQLTKQISRLVENRNLRQTLGDNGRRAVATRFTIENWNVGLKEAFAQAFSC